MTGRAFGAALANAGLGPDAAARKVVLFEHALAVLQARPSGPLAGSVRGLHVPGRIEVFGKHTDYAGGRSLICATDRGIVAVAIARDDQRLVVIDAATRTEVALELGADVVASGPVWATYVEAVARRVARNFPSSLGGATIAFASDLPQAAGLSSSSALVVAVFLALAGVSPIEECAEYGDAIHTPEDLAGYMATLENGLSYGRLAGDRGVGTFGGSEDHTAMLCCHAGMLSQYAFCPVRREADVALQDDLVFVVAASGVVAQKTGAAREAYNRAALAAGTVLERWNQVTGRLDLSLAAACTAAPDAPERIRDALARTGGDSTFPAAALRDRFDQFCEESLTIVPAASAAFAAGDVAAVGTLAARSQWLAERCLGNQVPETVHLARAAPLLGALASSAFGAGFGGSVWALVTRGRAASFLEDWRGDYLARFPGRSAGCTFFETRPGSPVIRA